MTFAAIVIAVELGVALAYLFRGESTHA